MEIGSEEHKNLFCRFFIDTHKPFQPEDLPWPNLSEETIKKLAAFPIWDYAIHTERQVFLKLSAYAQTETDPLLREALALQGYEEGRHADVLKYFLKRYGIPFKELPDKPLPQDLEWGFMSTGCGECIDSFFAFGFLEISKATGDYPRELIEAMEPIVQEEARHILFIQNWVLYQRRRRPFIVQPFHFIRTMLAFCGSAYRRLKEITTLGGTSFTIQAREYESSSMSPGAFIDLCMKENNRRLSPYHPDLLRPTLVPNMMKLARVFL